MENEMSAPLWDDGLPHHPWTDADYQSPQWKRLRVQAAARTDGVCQLCAQREGTEGHHLRYVHPEDMLPRWVAWLCPLCHGIATELRSMAKARALHPLASYAAAVAVIRRLAPKWTEDLRRELEALSPADSPDHDDRVVGALRGRDPVPVFSREVEDRVIGELVGRS